MDILRIFKPRLALTFIFPTCKKFHISHLTENIEEYVFEGLNFNQLFSQIFLDKQ